MVEVISELEDNSQLQQQQGDPPLTRLSSLQNAVQDQLVVSIAQRFGSQQISSPAASPATANTRTAAGTHDHVTTLLRNITHLTHSAATTPHQPSSDPSAASAATDETTADAAERHRLAGNQPVDLQAVAKWLEGMMPYLAILSAVFVYQYCTDILLFISLLCTLYKTNQLMRKVVAQKSDYQASEVAATVLYITINIGAVYWLMAGQNLHRLFALKPPSSPITVWQAAFMVSLADSIVRFCGLAPKLLVVAAVQSCGRAGSSNSNSSSSSRSRRQQARLLTLLEHIVLTYRALVPIPVWYTYLVTSTISKVLCFILAGCYLTFKGHGLLKQGRLVLVAAKLVIRSASGALVGRYWRQGEDAGDTCCPICQEPAASAVQLECSHIFCEDCISEWLERDKQATCPMCRTHIQPPGLQSFGDGATSLLPQLF